MNNNIIINGYTIPSKFFFAPINTGYSENGLPNSRLFDFHKKRSGKSIGISYIGNVAVDKKYITNENTLYLNKNYNFGKWRKLSISILENGSVPGVQLGCRVSKIIPMKSMICISNNEYIQLATKEFSSYSKDFIEEIIDKYIISAIRLYNLGFKVIQIHAAHGYFLSLALSMFFNRRKDIYGEKIFILKKIINGIKDVIPECILDVRISIIEGIESYEYEFYEKYELIRKIIPTKIDMISLSSGIYNINKNLIYPNDVTEHAVNEKYGMKLALDFENIMWNVAGNITDIENLKGLNLPNLTYSIGRALISDEYFVEKTLKGNKKSIRTCNRCNKCHYYSNSKKTISSCL